MTSRLYLAWKEEGQESQRFIGELKSSLCGAPFSRRGVGHGGTLDPFAKGLMLVGIGNATRLLAPLQKLPKSYKVGMLFGLSSDTFDICGEISNTNFQSDNLTDESLIQFLAGKVGVGTQEPPRFSAIKVDGKRAYDMARNGEDFKLQSRPYEILEAKHLSLEPYTHEGFKCMRWNFTLRVSSGTYIRAFARDWGAKLCGASGLLCELERYSIGPFFQTSPKTVAMDLAELEKHFDIEYLTESQKSLLHNGGRWQGHFQKRPGLLVHNNKALAWTQSGDGKLGRLLGDGVLVD